jgi:hypothetical protein
MQVPSLVRPVRLVLKVYPVTLAISDLLDPQVPKVQQAQSLAQLAHKAL